MTLIKKQYLLQLLESQDHSSMLISTKRLMTSNFHLNEVTFYLI
jgi:hypothetical protein